MTQTASRRVKLRVTGRVQGVYYRASTRDRARELGLVGWVRNTSDGAVEIEAQGPPEAVEALIEWCRRGPPAARVIDVARESIAASDGDSEFVVRY